MKKPMTTLVFEDHGQDFLEWDVNEFGMVKACRPFQGFVWEGKVLEKEPHEYKAGDTVWYFADDSLRSIRYPLKEVRHVRKEKEVRG